jgi:hypothetical protein
MRQSNRWPGPKASSSQLHSKADQRRPVLKQRTQ